MWGAVNNYRDRGFPSEDQVQADGFGGRAVTYLMALSDYIYPATVVLSLWAKENVSRAV